MKKVKIALIILGHSRNLFDFNRVRHWKSDLFEITNTQVIDILPDTEIVDDFLDQKFEPDQFENILTCPPDSDLAIGIMAYRFIDNFYMHRIGNNCAIVSLYGINDILSNDYISVENFILKQFYEMSAFKYLFKDISSSEVTSFAHRDTRGCLFDLNGDRQDIICNTETPIICDQCKLEFRKRQIEENIIIKFERELKKINKPFVLRMEIFIKKYPLLSVLISGLVAVILNIIASALWEEIKYLINIITKNTI